MTSEECIIPVHVRRTCEFIKVEVTPFSTTYGDMIKIICEKIGDPEPSRYYLALNYEKELLDDMVFDLSHKDKHFQMIMRTKWLLEYIAEQSLQRKRLISERDAATPVPEVSSVPAATTDEIPEEPFTPDTPTPTEVISDHDTSTTEVISDHDTSTTEVISDHDTSTTEVIPDHDTSTTEVISDHDTSTTEIPTEQNKVILGDVVRSTIKKIPRHDVQEYLHTALGKSFDILLMGSPRVGKSTLINAILRKNIAKTSAGRNACTLTASYYEYEETYISSADNTSTCSIRIWDAPGIEDWSKFDVIKHIQNIVKEKNPICLIYCASPGSYADIEHLKLVIEQCKKLKVFIALVVTNMYASDEVDDILDTFKTLLARHSKQTKSIDDVFHYGTIGLCTLVNSIEYEAQGKIMKQTGIDELMLGIMNSLSEEKLLQWCFALMDNGPFWIRAQSKIWKAFNHIKTWIGY